MEETVVTSGMEENSEVTDTVNTEIRQSESQTGTASETGALSKESPTLPPQEMSDAEENQPQEQTLSEENNDMLPSDGEGEETPEQPIPGQETAEQLTRILNELRSMAESQAQQAETEAREEGIRAIGAMDSSIKSVSDLLTMEHSDVFYDLVVHHNLKWEDAFRCAKYDDMMSKAKAKGIQEERNRALSRAHLEKTVGRGIPNDSVPPEVMRLYRAMNPTASLSEIVRHYNQTKQTQ